MIRRPGRSGRNGSLINLATNGSATASPSGASTCAEAMAAADRSRAAAKSRKRACVVMYARQATGCERAAEGEWARTGKAAAAAASRLWVHAGQCVDLREELQVLRDLRRQQSRLRLREELLRARAQLLEQAPTPHVARKCLWARARARAR